MGQALGLVLEGSRAEGRASGGGDGVGRGERGGGGVRASREPWGGRLSTWSVTRLRAPKGHLSRPYLCYSHVTAGPRGPQHGAGSS